MALPAQPGERAQRAVWVSTSAVRPAARAAGVLGGTVRRRRYARACMTRRDLTTMRNLETDLGFAAPFDLSDDAAELPQQLGAVFPSLAAELVDCHAAQLECRDGQLWISLTPAQLRAATPEQLEWLRLVDDVDRAERYGL